MGATVPVDSRHCVGIERESKGGDLMQRTLFAQMYTGQAHESVKESSSLAFAIATDPSPHLSYEGRPRLRVPRIVRHTKPNELLRFSVGEEVRVAAHVSVRMMSTGDR